MTQVDAADKTGVDRKTLARIERGEEVKQETLQKLANGLRVPTSFFDPPVTESPPITKLTKEDPEWDQDPFTDALIMLRELDADRLLGLLNYARKINWHLNFQPSDEKAHELLEQFDKAVHELHQHLTYQSPEWKNPKVAPTDLSKKLSALKKGRVVAKLMEQLAEYRIAILGADYLQWDVSEDRKYVVTELIAYVHTYASTRIVELSVEKSGIRTRRVPISIGREPPKFAPDTDPPTEVIVDGWGLGEEIPPWA